MRRLLIFTSLIAFSALRADDPGESANPHDWIKTEAQWTALKAGEVIVLEATNQSGEKNADHAAMAAILVDAPVDQVWDVVNDQDKAPDYIKTLLSSKRLEEHEGYSLLQQQVKVGFHKVKYIVKHMPSPPSVIHFARQSGDLKSMSGFWRFLPLGDEPEAGTLLIYRLSLEPDFPVPAFLIRKSLSENLPDTLLSVKNEVIRLHGGS